MKRNILLLVCFPVFLLGASCAGKKSGDVDVLPEPVINSIVTEFEGNKAVVGYPVTLKGENFSPVASDNKVLYGIGLDVTSIPVNDATSESIVFTAPEVSQNPLKIRVATKGKESNTVALEFTTKPKEEDEPWSDEPTIVLSGAKTVTICPGVEWTSFHGIWEGQIRNINIVRTTLNEHNSLGMYFNYTEDGMKDLDEKCNYLNAVAGTNGPMACCHFARVDGEIKHAPTEEDPWITNCAITIDDNVVNIVKVKDNYAAKRLSNKTVGCAGPLLVWEGEIQDFSAWKTQDFIKETHPRTAIGLSKDGKTVTQVAVDGRWSKSGWPAEQTAIGMPAATLAKLMRGLGCYKAMNFDGGGGTAMWVYGKGNSRNIVNHVCENRWDWNGTVLRATGNAVYVKSDLK